MLERYHSEVGVAVNHPFLKAAGELTLEPDTLSEWLTQDRIYALCGYPKFIAALILALPLSSTRHQQASQSLLGLLSFALSNIDREVGFFDSLGPKYGLDLEYSEPRRAEISNESTTSTSSSSRKALGKLQGSLVKPTTKAYVDLLIATGAEAGKNGGLEEALVLLWGMEKIYLMAWTYAKSQVPDPRIDHDNRTVKALKELIDNWTMPEFVHFVERIESEVDKLNLEEGTEAWSGCEEMFKYNLLLEQQFWPDM